MFNLLILVGFKCTKWQVKLCDPLLTSAHQKYLRDKYSIQIYRAINQQANFTLVYFSDCKEEQEKIKKKA